MMCDLYGANPSDKTLNQLRVDMFLRKSENLKCPLPKMRAMFQEGLTCTSKSHILKVVFCSCKMCFIGLSCICRQFGLQCTVDCKNSCQPCVYCEKPDDIDEQCLRKSDIISQPLSKGIWCFETMKSNQSLHICVRACRDVLEPAEMCQSLQGCVRACRDVLEHAEMCQSLQRCVRACRDVLEPAEMCQSSEMCANKTFHCMHWCFFCNSFS